jgi:hypothetical protein
VRIGLEGTKLAEPSAMETGHGAVFSIEEGQRSSRKKLSTSIQYITNQELLTADYNPALGTGLSKPEYNAYIFEGFNQGALDRSNDSSHHIAGFEILGPDGMRYIYALPVKNLEHREYLFSVAEPSDNCVNEVPSGLSYKVDGTDQFYQKKELPPYAHAYLLTAVLGPDYNDIDGTPGPSEYDTGFWITFWYYKAANYAWRAPFQNASYLRGFPLSDRDDKGSFMYGVREQYYLKYAQSKTHRAEFMLSPRDDNKGCGSEIGIGTFLCVVII